jgi:hypothetical protein
MLIKRVTRQNTQMRKVPIRSILISRIEDVPVVISMAYYNKDNIVTC